MPTKTHKYIVVGVILLFATLFLIDRYYWAQISQWREDQATNLWLGYTNGIGNLTVGLISSRKIPNPNGMPLLGASLSLLPNLLSVSFFLGVAQILLIALVGWKTSAGKWRYFLLATLPLLSSVVLRSTSVEFWNQYTITLLNIFFIFWATRYLDSASLWNIPPIALLVFLAPAIYLAGIVNAIVMALLTVGIMMYRRPSLNHVWAASLTTLLIGVLSFFLTWLPYLRNVGIEQIVQYSQRPDVPDPVSLTFKHGDLRILSPLTQFLLNLADKIYLVQVIFACVVFLVAFIAILRNPRSSSNFEQYENAPIRNIITLSGLFILLSYLLSALLGGPNWLRNERSDQTVQFLPLFLLFIFLLPFSIAKHRQAGKIVHSLSNLLLAAFVTINLLCGFWIIRDHLQYRGDVLTEADVPLINKMQAVGFIAEDWRNHSNSSVIPVDYDLGGGRWDNIPQFGKKLAKWYPAVMTQGRSFDYELLRRYGLTNEQEGVQRREFGNGRYLVTYAFDQPPQVTNGLITHYIFGRLRVSIVER